MLEFDFDDSVARGLRGYVRQVGRSVGLLGESSYVTAGDEATAYLALDGRLPAFPDHDVALLWHEEQGWSAAVEDREGGEPRVVARLEGDVLPAPDAVAAWVRGLFRQKVHQPVTARLKLRTGPLNQLLAPYRTALVRDR